MPITLNFTTIDAADAVGGWSTIAPAGDLATSDYPQKQGADCLEFSMPATSTGGLRTNAGTTFDVRNEEVGLWFLNPKTTAGGAEFIGTNNSSLRLRLYSGANFADYYQVQHKGSDGTFGGGWLYLRASGAAGSEDANSGTWTNTQVAAVDSIAVIVESNAANNGKNDARYGVDWAKRYDKIIVEGFNGGTTPYTLSDIADEGLNSTDGEWGFPNKTENFYEFFCGIDFGDGTAGAFEAENEFIFFNHSSSDHEYDIAIKNNFTVTLGAKNVGTDATYAQNGVQLRASDEAFFQLGSPVKPSPPLTVESGGELNCYATLIEGFGTVNLGSGGSGTIEFIKCDLYNNDEIELRSTGLDWLDVRLHFPEGEESDIGAIFNAPASIENIDVFQVTDGLVVRTNTTITEYKAGDSTSDIVVLEGVTAELINSRFSEDKLKRVT